MATIKRSANLTMLRQAAALLIAAALFHQNAQAGIALQTITLSQNPMGWSPASNGVFIGEAYPYAIDDGGRISLVADFRGDYGAPGGYGLWRYDRGDLTPIVRNDAIVEAYGKSNMLTAMYGVGVPADGIAFVQGTVTPDSDNFPEGIWVANDSGLRKVFLFDENLPGSAERWSRSSQGYSRSVGGRLLFLAETKRWNGSHYERRDGLWFAGPDGSPQLVAQQYSPLPGLLPGQQINYIVSDSMTLNERGDLAFNANFMETDSTEIAGQGIWLRSATGEIQLAAKSGDIIDVNNRPTSFFPLWDPLELNNRGELLLQGIVYPDGYNPNRYNPTAFKALWLQASDGTRRLVARTGSNDAHHDVVFGHFDSGHGGATALINDEGQVAFSAGFYRLSEFAKLQNMQLPCDGDGDCAPLGPTYYEGLWIESNGDLQLIAKSGDILPGDDRPLIWAALRGFNNAGQLFFLGCLVEGNHSTPPQFGFWALDSSGALNLIIKTGNQIDVAPGPEIDLRTVSTFSLLSSDNTGWVWPNNRGQIPLVVEFTDGTRGIVVANTAATTPEPGSLTIAAFASAFCMSIRRARRR